MEESSDNEIESMALLDGDYQDYMKWVSPPRIWDVPTQLFIKIALIRYVNI